MKPALAIAALLCLALWAGRAVVGDYAEGEGPQTPAFRELAAAVAALPEGGSNA